MSCLRDPPIFQHAKLDIGGHATLRDSRSGITIRRTSCCYLADRCHYQPKTLSSQSPRDCRSFGFLGRRPKCVSGVRDTIPVCKHSKYTHSRRNATRRPTCSARHSLTSSPTDRSAALRFTVLPYVWIPVLRILPHRWRADDREELVHRDLIIEVRKNVEIVCPS